MGALNDKKQTPLHRAIERGHEGAVLELLKLGSDPNAHSSPTDIPLFRAVAGEEEEMVRALLQAGSKVSAVDRSKQTALHRAAEKGSVGIMRLLLAVYTWAADADHRAEDAGKATPLHLCAAEGYFEAVTLLLESGALLEPLDAHRRTPLHRSCMGGKLRTTRLLLQKGANPRAEARDNFTPLHFAAVGGHRGVARALVEANGDVGALDRAGKSPFHHAAEGGYAKVLEALLPGAPEAAVNATDRKHRTPLHYACHGGFTESAVALLTLGHANSAILDREMNRTTPVHLTLAHWDPMMMGSLLACGAADREALSGQGKTPLATAVDRSGISVLGNTSYECASARFYSFCDNPEAFVVQEMMVRILLEGGVLMRPCYSHGLEMGSPGRVMWQGVR